MDLWMSACADIVAAGQPSAVSHRQPRRVAGSPPLKGAGLGERSWRQRRWQLCDIQATSDSPASSARGVCLYRRMEVCSCCTWRGNDM
jgi:hypothetical protein